MGLLDYGESILECDRTSLKANNYNEILERIKAQ